MIYQTTEQVVRAWNCGELERGDSGPDVASAQKTLNAAGPYGLVVDGKLGEKTQKAIEAEKAKLAGAPGGDLLVLPPPTKLITYLDDPAIDARPAKNYSQRSGQPQAIVLHWPGFVCSAYELGERWLSTSKDVSSHLGVDEEGVVQYLPFSARAWHATWINNASIGVDICQSPLEEDLEDELKTGKSVAVVDNPTGRGEDRVLSLDARVRENTLALVNALCAQFNIPLKAPGSGDVRHDVVFENEDELGSWRGVLGHHHVNGGKWDIGCWWQAIFGGTTAGDRP